MIQRIRQFCRALTAQLTPADRMYVDERLEPAARELYYAMHPADQVHALNVARTAARLAENESWSEPDQAFLIRCALLHDVGRQKGDMDVWGKVFAVLVHHFLPDKLNRWQKDVRCSWRDYPGYALYVYVHHPAIGAARLEAIDCPREAAVVSRHHEQQTAEDSPVLILLRAADEQN